MNNDAVELATRFFDAVCAGDLTTLRNIYAADAVVWHNTDQTEKTAEASLGTIQWLVGNIRDFRYENVRIMPTPAGFVRLHVCRGTHLSTGKPLCVPVACIGEVKDGRLVRFEEYFDSVQGAPDVPMNG